MNWGRIILAVLVLCLLGGSIYYVTTTLMNAEPGAAQPTSPTPPQQEPTSPEDSTPDPAQSAEPTPTPTPAPTPKLTGTRTLQIGATGAMGVNEFILKAGRANAAAGAGYDFDEVYARMVPYLGKQDFILGTLEGITATEGDFNASIMPEQMLDSLSTAGFDVVSLATEHIFDAGEDAARNTVEAIGERSMLAVGAYADADTFAQPTILEQSDVRIAVLSYTQQTLQPQDSQQIPVVKLLTDEALQADMNALTLEEKPVDLVIAMVHWGEVDQKEVSADQRAWAQKLSNAGVDVILGTHPYNLQPIEEITAADGGKTLVAYSLGNFLSGQRNNGLDAGAILNFKIVKDCDAGTCTYADPSFVPTWVLKYSAEGKYHYEIMPVTEFLEKRYQNMGLQDRERITQITDEVKASLGETVARLDTTIWVNEE